MFVTGANAIAQGMKSLDSVAREIAELNVKSSPSESAGDGEAHSAVHADDLAESIVDLKIYQRQVQAATKIVQTADEVIGFLLDVRA